MNRAIVVNRHRGLAEGELTRRYRRGRDALTPDELEDEYSCYDYDPYDYDDYWDPWRGRTGDDYTLLQVIEESIGIVRRTPKLGGLLSGAARLEGAAPAESARPPREEAQASFSPAELADELFDHVQIILSRADRLGFTYSPEFQGALLRINGGTRGIDEALDRFRQRPAPIVVSILFAPFWVRPLASWVPPAGDDASTTISLVQHLFQIYPVPKALYEPWIAGGIPSLKWISWLLLLGQGGNLHRAGRRFGWNVAKRFTHHFATAPDDLSALEACMWAEVARLGGNPVDFDRIRRNPAYAIDPTEGPVDPEEAGAHDRPLPWQHRRDADDLSPSFWQQTVGWLIRHRDRLTDEGCAAILEWAMHLYTEGERRWPEPRAPFSWSGREPASAHAAALEYQRQRDTPYGDLTWNAHGLDWDLREGDVAWTIRELTTSKALLEESRAMHHCVSSYAYRCAHGHTAIFSLCADGERNITIELEPSRRRIVQARGVCNRAATSAELVVLGRWLQAMSLGDSTSQA